MTATVSASSTTTAAPPAIRTVRPAIAIPALVLLAIAARIAVGWGTPLWFDETFSAVIASQPDFGSLIAWCRDEIGGPGYYVALWGWAQLFGTSAVALRSMSFVASVATCLLIAWRGHPDRRTRWLWAGLMALWLPALDPATNARCYALAMLVTTGQAIALRRLIEVPTRARALAWTSLSVLAILLHSYCALLAVAGGVLFVAVHRRRALACWPALAPLIPLAGWMAVQLPVLIRFGRAGAWYPPFGPVDLALAPVSFFESIGLALLVVVGLGVCIARGWRGDHGVAERATAASGLIALAMLLALAMLYPSFMWRYATPYGPSILFGLALWVRGLEPRFAMAPTILLATFAASTLGRTIESVAHPADNYRTTFTLQRPSEWLADRGARHLAFLWDSPTGTMSDPRRIGEVAGHFLDERDPRARVTVLRAPGVSAPTTVVAAALRRDPSIDSIIWLADRSVPGTHADPDRAMLARRGWACQDFGRAPIGMLACRAPAPSARLARL